MILLRALWGIIFFLLVEVVFFLPLYILGLIFFPLFYHFARLKFVESRVNKGHYIIAFRNPVLDEWLGNHEDGLRPTWWEVERQGSAYGWFVRNPVCNMRFWPIVSTLPNPDKLGWVGTVNELGPRGWFFAWQGWYTGFYWNGKKYGTWLGWKISPRDKQPNAPRDYRWFGVGLASQFWRH